MDSRRIPVILALVATALVVVIGVRVSAGADTGDRDTTPVELQPGVTPSTTDAPDVTTPETPTPSATTPAPKPRPTGGPVTPRVTDDDDDDDDGDDGDDDDDEWDDDDDD